MIVPSAPRGKDCSAPSASPPGDGAPRVLDPPYWVIPLRLMVTGVCQLVKAAGGVKLGMSKSGPVGLVRSPALLNVMPVAGISVTSVPSAAEWTTDMFHALGPVFSKL